MSRVSLIRRLCFIFLVSVLETRAKSVTLTNLASGYAKGTIANDSSEPAITSRPEDQDPIEASETIVYNRFANPPENDKGHSASEEDPEGPEDHVIPYSEHENPKEIPTKPKYTAPGQWAKPSRDREDVSLEDVPTKLYAQVRKTHTVRRLPRWKAVESADSAEEKENAARLKEVVKNTKVNTVYTEEGYEDSAYDHAGHVRDADYHEGYARKLREQIDARKKSKDDENNEEEERSNEFSKHKRIDPEEFKDYDEDYRDFEYRTDSSKLVDVESEEDKWKKTVHPKSVAENGIQKLQEDLEREAEEAEKGIEINKLEKDSSDRKVGKEGRRKKQGKELLKDRENDDSIETLEESQDRSISTERSIHETTISTPISENVSNNPESYRYEVDGKSPYTEAIDFQPVDKGSITPSYGQIFWDYFKTQNQFTTMQPPIILESTTASPNPLQASSIVGNANLLYGGQIITPFPVVESATLQDNSQLTTLEGINQNEQFPEIYKVIPSNDPGLLLGNSVTNLDGTVEFDKNFGNSFFDPTLHSFTNRKPRYKITVRQKPTKSIDPPTTESPKESRNTLFHDNYMKVLMHLKNENNAKNLHPNSLQKNKDQRDLTRPRSSFLQNENPYYNFDPRGRRSRVQVRKMSSIPAVDLLPPAPLPSSDYARYKEANDHVTRAGRASKSMKTVPGSFRRQQKGVDAGKIRAKRRERRSTAWESVQSLANDSASNRGETERIERNTRIEERNPRRGATRETTKQPVEKKSKSHANDPDEERESSLVVSDTSKNRNTPTNLEYSNEKGKSHEELLEESPKVTEDVINEEIDARFNENEEDPNEEVEVEVPEFDYVEEIEEDDSDNTTTIEATTTSLDLQKYPFYNDEKLPTPSALRYAIDPRRVPKKTYGKMEFYNSRDAYKHCEEVEPKLDVLPKEESPVPDKGLKEDLPRLTGLGDKLDCFKAKYFDEEPFDNPLFLEKEVEDPVPALNLDTKRFASRIMMFPKEDDDLVEQKSSKRPESNRQQKRPDPIAARVQKTRRIRYKMYPKTRMVTRPRVYRVNSQGRFVKTSQRPRKVVVKRPVSSASEMSAFYMPYQNQVYEDVMGTIKNMANSYQVEEITTVPTSEEVTITTTDSNKVKTNASANSTSNGSKEKDGLMINIIERPSKVHVNIEGLVPPNRSNRHRTMNSRSRVPQRNRTRMQFVQMSVRPVKRRRKIRIYKRDTKSSEEYRINEDSKGKSRGTNIPQKRKSNFVNASGDGDQMKQKSQRVVYTIMDRIKHSKPKEEARGIGKFANASRMEEDNRRKEPRYNYIRRRKPSNLVLTTTETTINSTDKIDWTESTTETIATTNGIVDSRELLKENQEVQHFVNNTDNEKLNFNETKNNNSYAVHENIDEVTTQKPSEISGLKTFLDTESPGYTDFSSEELKRSFFQSNNDSKGSNFSNEKEDEDSKAFRSYFPEEKSASEKIEPKESSEDSSSMESDSKEEDRTFFSYSDRPLSPAENNEDSKYSELGPRINKPSFFHPPFAFSNRRTSSSSEEDSKEVESTERKEYVFPWYRDKEDKEKRSRYRGRMGEYEYPWERRERLAREERRKREGKRRRFSFDDEDDDKDDISARKYRRNVYPRGRYRFWTRKEDEDSKESDNVEISSEHKPIMKYSSRYNAKNATLPVDEASTNVEDISRSISKFLEGDSEEKSSKENSSQERRPNSLKRSGISRGMIVPEDVTLPPTRRGRSKDTSKTSTGNSTEIIADRGDSLQDEGKRGHRNTLDTSESRSTKEQPRQRRRRPKTVVSMVESTPKPATRANRSRRRQKSTTPGIVTPTTSTSTTSAPRVVRRKPQKSVKHLKISTVPKVEDKSNNYDDKGVEISSRRNRLSNDSKISKENEGRRSRNELRKSENTTDRELKEKSFEGKETSNESITRQEGNGANLNSESKSIKPEGESDREVGRKSDEVIDSKQTSFDVGNRERFDFKDVRVEKLSDFIKSDDDYDDKYGNILKSDTSFTPQGAVQLSEQGSREIVSTVSWISENYNF